MHFDTKNYLKNNATTLYIEHFQPMVFLAKDFCIICIIFDLLCHV